MWRNLEQAAKRDNENTQHPQHTWSKIRTDLFTTNDTNNLIIVDYYSDFRELDELLDATSMTTTDKAMQHFSKDGIPNCVVSDDKPHFVCSEFMQFTMEWEFTYITSSLYHSQSSGKAESAVTIAKMLLKKVAESKENIWQAILEWRNSSSEGLDSNPIQHLMTSHTYGLVLMAPELLQPLVMYRVTD
ncbi:unnamed protein product [Caretta caretta]